MPPLPGEERLVTLFADVHYYFAKPTIRPVKHRFDKASYFYIYYNSTRQTSRLEIANNPGTELQDAFNGYLDKCRITNSYKFPTLMTIEVDVEGIGSSPTSPTSRDPDEWRLESGDLRDARRDKYKLHTLDIYFWTPEDAKLATQFLGRLLASSQLDIAEALQPSQNTPHQDTVSPVVQNLEKVAISDPAYRNGQTRNSQNQAQQQSQSIKLPPPPPPQPAQSSLSSSSPSSHTAVNDSRSGRTASTGSPDNTAKFTPAPYNPAAPAAPEPRVHREKTPPPEDDETISASSPKHNFLYGTGHQTAQPFSGIPGPQPIPYGHYGSPPPPQQGGTHPPSTSAIPQYGSPSPQQKAGRTSFASNTPAFAPPPPSVPPGYGPQPPSVGYGSPPLQQQLTRTSVASGAPSFAPPPASGQPFSQQTTGQAYGQDSHRHSTAAEHYVPDPATYRPQPVETPGEQFYSTLPQEKKPLQHIHPQYPEYFPSSTSPNESQQQAYQPGHEYAIHQQVYNPANDPAVNRSHGHGHGQQRPSRQEPSRNENKSSVFSGFDKLRKKIDSKVGDAVEKGQRNKYL